MKQSASALTFTGLAGAMAIAGTSQSYGTIINLTDPSNITGHANTAGSGSTKEYYNVLTGVTTSAKTTADDLEFGYFNGTFTYNGSTYTEFFTGVAGLKTGAYVAAVAGGNYYSYPIPKGATIGTGGNYGFRQKSGYFTLMSIDVNGTQYGFSTENQVVYLGFQFLDSNDNLLHDGWLELESATYTSASSPGGIIFLGGAYNSVADSAGGTITAGQVGTSAVPEPGTLAALAFGAASLVGVGLKRRRTPALAA